MIINWEKGKAFFGGSDELYRRELFNFVHSTVPRSTERALNFIQEQKIDDLRSELSDLQGSAK